MGLCATYNEANQVLIVNPPPADMSTCALIISTPAEVQSNPLALSVEDGTAIATAVVLCWVAGAAARVLIRSLSLGDTHEQD